MGTSKFSKIMSFIMSLIMLFSIANIFAEGGFPFVGYTKKTAVFEFFDTDKKLLKRQILKEGDALEGPELPKALKNKTFRAWRLENGDVFNDFGKINKIEKDGEIIRLYPYYSASIKLIYRDDLGNVFRTFEFEDGDALEILNNEPNFRSADEELKSSKSLVGWSKLKNGTESLVGKWQVELKESEANIVQAGKRLKVDGEVLNLYPILKEGFWVSYDSMGGTPFIQEFISSSAENKKISVPKRVLKQGYDFTGWYEDESCTIRYDENKDVEKSFTLYAGWTETDDTKYIVKYFYEYQKDTAVSDINDENAWDYKYIGSENKKGKTGARAEYDSNFIFKAPYSLDRNGYELNAVKTEDVFIAPDGSTVYNIYYKCKQLNISFSGKNREKTTVVFPQGAAEAYEKTWRLKYKQNLRFIYDILKQDGVIDFMNANGYNFYSTEGDNEQIEPNDIATRTAEPVDRYFAMLKPGKYNSYYNYFFETLDGKAPEGKEVVGNVSRRRAGDSRKYYLFISDKFNSYGNGLVMFRSRAEYPGFRVMPELSDGHYGMWKDGRIGIWFRYHKDWKINQLVDENGNGINYWNEGQPLNIYFTRNSYKLNFEIDGGPKVKTDVELENDFVKVLYEDDLKKFIPSNYKKGVTKYVTADGREYTFDGWYTDDKYGKEFDFDAQMPYYDLHVYAKWKPKLLSVEFKIDSKTLFEKIENIPYGDSIAKPQRKPQKEGFTFLGWLLNGKPFNFNNAVTENLVLTANWRSTELYELVYDLNGAKGQIKDSNKYHFDSAAIVASPNGVIAPEGKRFIGWKLEGTDEIYYPNSLIKMKKGGIRLIAQWKEPDELTQLTYDRINVPLSVTKRLVNGKLTDGQFSFELYRGNTHIETKTNDANGVVSFTDRTFSRTGKFTYTIKEVAGSNSKISYDASVYKVTIRTTAEGGKLKAQLSLEKDGVPYDGRVEFVNKVNVPKTGDSFTLLPLYIAVLAIVSLAGVTVILKKRESRQ